MYYCDPSELETVQLVNYFCWYNKRFKQQNILHNFFNITLTRLLHLPEKQVAIDYQIVKQLTLEVNFKPASTHVEVIAESNVITVQISE